MSELPLRQLVKDLADSVHANREAGKAEHEALRTFIAQKFDGDGGLNEGVIPAIKRHNKEIGVLQQERLQSIKPEKDGIMGWFEKHPNTVKYIILTIFVVFHMGALAKYLKWI